MSHDTWAHAIVRPVTRRLSYTLVTPNHLTALRFITGLASGIFVAVGDPTSMGFGAALFLFSFFLDRADGELARATGKSSSWGHRFDLVSDYMSNILIFVGLGIGLSHAGTGGGAVLLGSSAGGAIAGIFALVSYVERVGGIDAAAFPTAVGFDPDDAMLIVPVAIWSGADMLLIMAAGIGAPLFLAWTCWRFRKHLLAHAQWRPAVYWRRAGGPRR